MKKKLCKIDDEVNIKKIKENEKEKKATTKQ